MVLESIDDAQGLYDLLYIDPPWQQAKGGRKNARPKTSGAPLDYNTCSLEEIERHIGSAVRHTPEKSVLFLWTIDKYLFEAQQIAENLGYKLHARMIWNKVTGIPAAFTVRFGHEYLLYMYRGGAYTGCYRRERENTYGFHRTGQEAQPKASDRIRNHRAAVSETEKTGNVRTERTRWMGFLGK